MIKYEKIYEKIYGHTEKIFLFFFCISILINPVSAKESFVILNSDNVPDMLENIEYIKSLGGDMVHRFPPNVLIGDIPEDQYKNLIGHKNIKEIISGPVDISKIDKYGKTARIAATVWNNNLNKKDKKEIISENISEIKKIKPLNDVLIIPENLKTQTKIPESPPYGAGFYDTSEYFMGDIAVGVVFVESNGSIDPESEDWTSTEESQVVSGITNGLSWWRSQEPRAKLTFTYNINYEIPTSYEPITRNSYLEENKWITDAMNYLGFNKYTSYYDNVYDFNNYNRKTYDTDWAYTIFVVDSSNDVDGSFPNGYSAYAWLGGPHVMTTYDNDGYGISNFNYITAHETAHNFYATDEYNGATEYSGYLNAHDIEGSGDIMDCGLCWGISSGTKLQLGWRDTDGDNIFDIIDFGPVSILNAYSPDPTNDNTPTYTGRGVTIDTYPNNNPRGQKHDITINDIEKIQYNVDSGTWYNVNPLDGKFNDSTEYFKFTTFPLSDGTHSIRAQVTNTAGLTGYSADTLTINTGGGMTVSNLKNVTYQPNYIKWTWTDPANPTFDKVKIYINGKYKGDVPKGVQKYNATQLLVNESYQIGTRAVNTAGVVFGWKNHTSMTKNTRKLYDNFDDNILNTAKWIKYTKGTGPSINEVNKRVEATFPYNSRNDPTGVFSTRYESKCKLRGDFDIQVDYKLLTWPQYNGVRLAERIDFGDVERTSWTSADLGGPRELYLANFGLPSGLTTTTHASGKLRMARWGNKIGGYYLSGSSWKQLNISTVSKNDTKFSLSAWSHDFTFSDRTVKLSYDNMYLNYGQLICS